MARELAFQILFQVDIGRIPWEDALKMTMDENGIPKHSEVFLEELVSGVMDKLQEVDYLLTRSSEEWPLQRMASTDRNILRLAVYEILHQKDIPVEVTVNEAVEIAKKYGEEDSGRFVNGVLGTIIKELQKQINLESTEAEND
jgi:N utilization substance protein B